MEDNSERGRAGSLPGNPDGNTAGVGAGGGGDRTAAVYGIREPLLEPGVGTANGVAARDDLYLRGVTVRGLAQTGVGGGLVLLGLILIINILARTILSRGIAVPRS